MIYTNLYSVALHLILIMTLTMTLNSNETKAGSSLSHDFYQNSCPNLFKIVEDVVIQAVDKEKRMAASLLRLHFHDCFVNGCDASILLDDTATAKGEKTSPPNNNSIRGFDVIDAVKSAVEAACPGTVSCADILALAANVSVAHVGGPHWMVRLGRRDSLTASYDAPLQFLPRPDEDLTAMLARFAAVGMTVKDAVVLSGAHSIGFAGCDAFSSRLYNFSGTGKPDPSLVPTYLTYLQRKCPLDHNVSSSIDQLYPLDVTSPLEFDNKYYTNLLHGQGLLVSDQGLYSTPNAAYSSYLVKSYSSSQKAFFYAFAKSMIRMGNLHPLIGATQGEIRLNCRKAN